MVRAPNKSQHTKLTLEKKIFSRRSCRDSSSQPFDHEFGALTTKLSRLPMVMLMRGQQTERICRAKQRGAVSEGCYQSIAHYTLQLLTTTRRATIMEKYQCALLIKTCNCLRRGVVLGGGGRLYQSANSSTRKGLKSSTWNELTSYTHPHYIQTQYEERCSKLLQISITDHHHHHPTAEQHRKTLLTERHRSWRFL